MNKQGSNHSVMDETTIIRQCQTGDRRPFAELYDAYAERIYRFIYFKTMHRETAEDLTSQTFTKALEALDRFNPSKGTFSSWLYRIARNTVIDHYRTAKPVDDIDGIYSLHDGTTPEIDHDQRETVRQVRSYLETVKPEHREIVTMRLWDELTYAEIAAITGKSVESCKMTFSRAMARLREELAFALAALLIFIVNN